jgi:hypothetical protein
MPKKLPDAGYTRKREKEEEDSWSWSPRFCEWEKYDPWCDDECDEPTVGLYRRVGLCEKHYEDEYVRRVIDEAIEEL